MSAAIIHGARPDCPAPRHDTSQAYRKHHCRCPQARQAEVARKAPHDRQRIRDRSGVARTSSLMSVVGDGVPPFFTDPRRNCADLPNPDVMFPERPQHVAAAQKVCAGCPLTRQCDQWALDTRQIFGVWGGVRPADRRRQVLQLLKQEGKR